MEAEVAKYRMHEHVLFFEFVTLVLINTTNIQVSRGIIAELVASLYGTSLFPDPMFGQ